MAVREGTVPALLGWTPPEAKATRRPGRGAALSNTMVDEANQGSPFGELTHTHTHMHHDITKHDNPKAP